MALERASGPAGVAVADDYSISIEIEEDQKDIPFVDQYELQQRTSHHLHQWNSGRHRVSER